jgi:SAM-dependent methyltransferase
MNEATKTREYRGQAFVQTYLSGEVLDIGCGPDLVVPTAQPFDLVHGDANCIADYLSAQSFDCVHSSHCLEHMKDVPKAIGQWWSLVRPGGFMIVTVPEENLYEQGFWPSLFNSDHKATFRLGGSESWSPVSYDLEKLVNSLPGARIVQAEVQDAGYDRRKQRRGLKGFGRLVGYFRRVRGATFGLLGVSAPAIQGKLERLEQRFGWPVDQTLGNALAQIQIVARKS